MVQAPKEGNPSMVKPRSKVFPWGWALVWVWREWTKQKSSANSARFGTSSEIIFPLFPWLEFPKWFRNVSGWSLKSDCWHTGGFWSWYLPGLVCNRCRHDWPLPTKDHQHLLSLSFKMRLSGGVWVVRVNFRSNGRLAANWWGRPLRTIHPVQQLQVREHRWKSRHSSCFPRRFRRDRPMEEIFSSRLLIFKFFRVGRQIHWNWSVPDKRSPTHQLWQFHGSIEFFLLWFAGKDQFKGPNHWFF